MEENLQNDEKQIIEYANSKNVLIGKKSLALLREAGNFEKIIDEMAAEGTFVLDEGALRERIIRLETKVGNVREDAIVKKSHFRPEAAEVDADLSILKQYDVTGQAFSDSGVKDFLNLFQDKYKFLSSVLRQRPNLKAKPISELRRVRKNEELDIFGMVSKKWKTKNGNTAILIEDLEEECIGIVLKDDQKLTNAGQQVLLDDVVAIRGAKITDEMMTIKEIFWPELPIRPLKEARRDLSVLAISDLHVGSKLFLEEELGKFISWLNGGASNGKDAERLGKIKYLIIAGDNVDGVGVYPDQFDELLIKDIYEQYDKFSDIVLEIPEYIEVIICPGQHDAVRRADPQPAIPKEFVKKLSEIKNVHLVGSPSWFEMEGLKCLIYHGASLHDLYSSLNFLSPREPQKAMIELLKRRSLMPSYGLRQPYVPERKDFMLIREEPDIYFGGDMHHNGHDIYRGCLVVNAGTWQKQTEFQLMEGHIPTPGIATEIGLKTRNIMESCFYGGGK